MHTASGYDTKAHARIARAVCSLSSSFLSLLRSRQRPRAEPARGAALRSLRPDANAYADSRGPNSALQRAYWLGAHRRRHRVLLGRMSLSLPSAGCPSVTLGHSQTLLRTLRYVFLNEGTVVTELFNAAAIAAAVAGGRGSREL